MQRGVAQHNTSQHSALYRVPVSSFCLRARGGFYLQATAQLAAYTPTCSAVQQAYCLPFVQGHQQQRHTSASLHQSLGLMLLFCPPTDKSQDNSASSFAASQSLSLRQLLIIVSQAVDYWSQYESSCHYWS